MRPAACADCGALFALPRTQRHDDDCPVGRDLLRSSAADADWFERQPLPPYFVRPLTWGEAVLLGGVFGEPPAGWQLVGPVLVRELAPGVRTRDYSRLFAVPVREVA